VTIRTGKGNAWSGSIEACPPRVSICRPLALVETKVTGWQLRIVATRSGIRVIATAG
jgi:hypothetical protein